MLYMSRKGSSKEVGKHNEVADLCCIGYCALRKSQYIRAVRPRHIIVGRFNFSSSASTMTSMIRRMISGSKNCLLWGVAAVIVVTDTLSAFGVPIIRVWMSRLMEICAMAGAVDEFIFPLLLETKSKWSFYCLCRLRRKIA